MPPRYLIRCGGDLGAWPELDAAIERLALRPIMASGALRIWGPADLPALDLADGACVILGDLFSGEPPFATLRAIEADLAAALRRPDGWAYLLRRCWGNYLAILVDEDRQGCTIVRPPFGQLPAYVARSRGATFLFSDVTLAKELGLIAFAFDWQKIAHHLITPNLRGRDTCIVGVEELIGGFGMVVGQRRTETFEAWNPWHHAAREDYLHDEREAIARLRSCIDAAVAALARTTRHAILGVSGGLDSSIVAAALVAAGTPLSCLTLFTRDPAGDERAYARALAAHLGIDLFECFEAVGDVDLTRSDAAHLPRPVARGFAQSGNRSNLAIADRAGGDAFFSGGGGDNVFCSLQSAAPVADCLMTGRVMTAFRTAGDIARIAECGRWEALRDGVRRTMSGRRTYRWRPELQFLDPDLAAVAGEACVPIWSPAPRDALPGKATHVAYLVGILNHIEGYSRERTHRMAWPLLAQPIVELCLSIPSWMWGSGGINRSPARRAYADALPPVVLGRRAKGTPDSFIIELFEANRRMIRDFLCDGHLAGQGLLDRARIAQFLAEEGPVRGLGYWRIMALADVEAWIRSQAFVEVRG